ncbi:hypothetical protein NC652_027641 [Populus alba x Populus x berolinensis]|nr:hypothetical protein NC652_027641 [Populus alba x Populus x berolinensis]
MQAKGQNNKLKTVVESHKTQNTTSPVYLWKF